jgi:hypothetical protein
MCYFFPWPGGVNYQYQMHKFNARPVVYYYIENPLVIISINGECWRDNVCLARDRNFGN